ncbi:MAG: alpha/beta hydrolase-fold protein [Meiothermus sp.]|nr:alpha/beta hydrolase-fold protein [Meiothermus sp.]
MKVKTASRAWQTYPSNANHTVVGDLWLRPEVYSPQLKNWRDIVVYLPPSYHLSNQRYPVLYMHDGQNIFDEATSYVGEWQVDESMEWLAETEGLEVIVVGVPNAGVERLNEYSPFRDPKHGGGKGDAYLRFLTQTVKPMIDEQFRTLPGRENTGVMGSSMGGFISLYAYYACPEVFGRAGVVSPALWFGDGAIYDFVAGAPQADGKLYMDVGHREVTLSHIDSGHYLEGVRLMDTQLREKGWRDGKNYMYVEDKRGIHNEAHWARRFPDMVRFLFRSRYVDRP